MWNPRRKIPQITGTDVVDKVSPLRVNRCNARAPIQHIGPLGGLVPMQLTHPTGIQAHVYASDILGNTEFPRGDLARPTARFQPHMGVGERKT
jgi:hypothetical protein